MNRKLLAAVVSGALALPMAASVQADEESAEDLKHKHSYTLYGSVRSGLIVRDEEGDADAMWDLGAADSGDLSNNRGDQLWSRIGVKASHKLDNGMMAGLHIEKRLDNFRTRHQNVWLENEMGRITLGQQSSPYQGATSWDGANFLGGNVQLVGSRKQGVSFASKLGGPFNFKALVMDDNSHKVPAGVEHMGTYDTSDDADPKKVFGHKDGTKSDGYGDGIDGFELSGAFDAGIVNINVGYADAAYKDNDDATYIGVTVGSSLGKVGWEAGFETKNPDMSGDEDTNVTGLFVDYDLGAGAAYFYYENSSGKKDDKAWVAGYSHALASGVKVIGEHRDQDTSGTTSVLAVVVGF